MSTSSCFRFRVGAALVPLVSAILASVALATEVTVEQVFPVTPGGRLVLDADRGSIRATTAETNAVGLTVIREVKGADAARTEEILARSPIESVKDGNAVRITVRSKDRAGWLGKQPSLKVKFLVTVPRQFNLDLKTAGGSIEIADLTGQAGLQTAGGSIRAASVDGSLTAKTAGGSIHAGSVTGSVEADTAGGSIQLGEVNGDVRARTAGGSIRVNGAGGTLDARTSGGSIDLKALAGPVHAETSGGSISARFSKMPAKDSSLETSGGSITAVLPEGAGCILDAETSGGRVSSDLPVTIRGKGSKSELKGDIGGGGATLKVRASGGSIQIKSSPANP